VLHAVSDSQEQKEEEFSIKFSNLLLRFIHCLVDDQNVLISSVLLMKTQ